MYFSATTNPTVTTAAIQCPVLTTIENLATTDSPTINPFGMELQTARWTLKKWNTDISGHVMILKVKEFAGFIIHCLVELPDQKN